MRRFWRRRLGKAVIILAVLAGVLGGASLAGAHYTERNSFCATACHEMKPFASVWQVSSHKNVACVRCHIKPGTVELIAAKASALREVWKHFTRKNDAPIYVTQHIPDSTCTAAGCHAPGTLKDPIRSRTASFSHKGHAQISACIVCHSQVVHRNANGKPYVDPRSMAFCFQCHQAAKRSGQCEKCHTAPHPDRGRCAACHQLTSWASTFKHPVTVGPTHRTLSCEKCHAKSASTATAQGLASGCVSCHAKQHKSVTVVLCAKCHVPTHWKPSTFKHPTSGCESCHTLPHPRRGACLKCHSTTSFTKFSHPGGAQVGAHATIACEKCHANGFSAPGQTCSGCHHPKHVPRGTCSNCHTQASWASSFNHPVALAGVHASFPCERCHTSGTNAPGRSCVSCHGANHGGLTDCQSCHRTSGWVPATFSHPATGMPGTGSIACVKCHPGGNFTSSFCSCHGGNPPGD